MSRLHRAGPLAVGVVVPVHNEEDLLPLALDSLSDALVGLPSGVESRVALVLDDCTDSSSDIAWEWSRTHPSEIVIAGAGNVGAARRAGCRALLSGWQQLGSHAIWMATTDADSRVPADWLTVQLSARRRGVDLWAGRVRVADWSLHDADTRNRWSSTYAREDDPIHGASLGFTATAYLRLGGFRSLATGEDRDLYRRARSWRYRILHDTKAVVETSGRREGRAPLGFAHALTTAAEELAPTA